MLNLLSHKLGKNILANQLGFLVSVVVTLFLSPFVVHTLGDASYGIWSLIISFTGHYGLLAFGIQGAVTRFISHSVAKEETDKASAYLTGAFCCLAGAALLCILIGAILSRYFSAIFSIDPVLTPHADTAFFCVSLTMAATFLFTVFQCNLFAHQRFDIINKIGVSATLIRALLTVIVLKAGYGLLGLASLGLTLTVLTGSLELAASRRFAPKTRIRFSRLSKPHTLELVRFGAKSFLLAISVTLVYQCDLMVIGIFLSPLQITLYSLAATLITYLIQFVGAVSNAMNPYATERFAKEGMPGLRAFYTDTGHLMYMLAGLAFAGCFILGKDFFSLWMGPEYVESGTILYVLLIPQFFSTGYTVFTLCFGAMNRIGWIAVLAIGEGLLNLGLSVALVHRFGVYGVAVGTLVPLILNRGIIGPLYAGRQLNLYASYGKALLSGGFIALAGILAGLLFRQILPPANWALFVVNVVFITGVCGLAGYPFIKLRNRLFKAPV